MIDIMKTGLIFTMKTILYLKLLSNFIWQVLTSVVCKSKSGFDLNPI